jgi:hypothetical protein
MPRCTSSKAVHSPTPASSSTRFAAVPATTCGDSEAPWPCDLDVQYTTLKKITVETAAVIRELRRITNDITIHYTVGNHDIILEHYIGAWGGLQHVPLLNVTGAPDVSASSTGICTIRRW